MHTDDPLLQLSSQEPTRAPSTPSADKYVEPGDDVPVTNRTRWISRKGYWVCIVSQDTLGVDAYLESFGFVVLLHSALAGLLLWMGSLHEPRQQVAPGVRLFMALFVPMHIAWVWALGLGTLCFV